jgi:hypothetical protein
MKRVGTASTVIAVVLLLLAGTQATVPPHPAEATANFPPTPQNVSTVDLATLHRAVPGVMTDWVAAGRANGEVGDRNLLGMIMASLGDDAEAGRRQLLTGVLTPRLIEPQVDHFADQFWAALYRVQPSTVYVGNRFEVAAWQSAQVLGNLARVQVSARQHYTFPNGTEGVEPWHRYVLVLERAPASRFGWLLVEATASLEPRASESVADR